MAGKTKKVFEIGKDLGVDSKAIIAKCKAEGVPGIETHMSPVKIGLEMTIREWFSEGATKTAVETTEHVDVAKVRKPARRKAGGQDHGSDHHDHGDSQDGSSSTATITAPAEPAADAVAAAPVAPAPVTPAAPPAPVVAGPVAQAAPTSAPTAPSAAAATEQHTTAHRRPVSSVPTAGPTAPRGPITGPASSASRPAALGPTGPVTRAPSPAAPGVRPSSSAPVTPPPIAARAPVAGPTAASGQPGQPSRPLGPTGPITGPAGAAGRPNVPTRPKDVRPLGVPLEKQKFELRGPQVVRIEKPDVLNTPKPRRPAGAGGAGTGSSDGSVPGISRSRGPVRGRGVGTPGEPEGDDKPKTARRSTNLRRGRSAEALPTGPGKFSEQDLLELDARLNRASGFLKQRRRDLKKHEGSPNSPAPAASGQIEISEPITIKSLSAAAGIKATDIIKFLFKKGIMATINSAIDTELAQEVTMEYDLELIVAEQKSAEQMVLHEFDNREMTDERLRPPVVTVMGHVDHGKTSLLDRIRKADVAAHEAGGITQHVGAYRVTVQGSDGRDKTVVFLDTPGHEAFTSMRARGAGVTDMVVLVVAADDGVMPQTIESINHAKAADVPLIVALNKIDKPEATEANIRKIYGQLAEHGLNPTEWGGTTEVMKVSATSGQGVTELLEMLDYQAELLQLKADYGGMARGTVIEAVMQPGRGPVARLLVEQGMMNVGDFVVIGRAFGRVRDMTNEYGKVVTEAGPSTPLELSGIDLVPDAGDKFYVTDSLSKAEEIAVHYREAERQKQLASQTKVTLENFANQLATGQAKDLRVILKADVQGSIKPIIDSLTKLSTSEVAVKVLHSAVGGITEADVTLADASDAVIIGFHVIAPQVVRDLAEQKGVEIRTYRIIYEITDEVKKGLEGMLAPEIKEEILGTAEVRQVFKITKVGNVAGSFVTEGVIQRNMKMRVQRDNTIVTDNRAIDSLRRLKDDAKEVRAGMECGIRLVGFDDIKPGDKLVCYNTVSVKRKLG